MTERARLELEGAKPLRGGEAPPPAGGLFDEAAQAPQLFDAIPVARRADGSDTRLTTRDAALAEAERADFHADLVQACKD